MKRCSRCQKLQERSEFHRDRSSRDGLVGTCKSCARDRSAERAEYMAEWHTRHRGRKYGLTPDEYEDLERRSGGLCTICRKPPTGKRDRLMVDHDHETNQVRDMLCHPCNVGIGLLGDDPVVIERAARYIRLHRPAS